MKNITPALIQGLLASPVVSPFRRALKQPLPPFVAINDPEGTSPAPRLVIQAEAGGDDGLFQEITVSAFNRQAGCVCDVLVGLDPVTKELRVMITANSDGDGDKVHVVYPERTPELGYARE